MGVDIAPSAIRACKSAEEAASQADPLPSSVQWVLGDMHNELRRLADRGGVDFIFDCQVMHTLSRAERPAFLSLVMAALVPGGQYLALTGNSQDSRVDLGPTMLSAVEVVQPALQAGLHLLSLQATRFAPTHTYGAEPPLAWEALFCRPAGQQAGTAACERHSSLSECGADPTPSGS